MVNLIAGKKGSGKTKTIVKLANEQVESSSGHVVFIDDDKRNIYELHHDVRFMNMEDYPVKTPEEFFGFLCGIISNDFDIETIFIDGLINITAIPVTDLGDYIAKLDELSDQFDLSFTVTVNCTPEDLPEQLAELLI